MAASACLWDRVCTGRRRPSSPAPVTIAPDDTTMTRRPRRTAAATSSASAVIRRGSTMAFPPVRLVVPTLRTIRRAVRRLIGPSGGGGCGPACIRRSRVLVRARGFLLPPRGDPTPDGAPAHLAWSGKEVRSGDRYWYCDPRVRRIG